MVGEALGGDRIIGMVLLQPKYQTNDEDRPPVFAVGCAGVITHAEPLGDWRFNIVLRGIERFRIMGEDSGTAYRIARIDGLPELVSDEHRTELRRLRPRLEALLAAAVERAGSEPRFPPAIPDEDLVNALAQHLELEPLERQGVAGTGRRARPLPRTDRVAANERDRAGRLVERPIGPLSPPLLARPRL